MISRLFRLPRQTLSRKASNTDAHLRLELDSKGFAKRGNLIIWKDAKKPIATSKGVTLPDNGRYWVLGFDDQHLQALPVLPGSSFIYDPEAATFDDLAFRFRQTGEIQCVEDCLCMASAEAALNLSQEVPRLDIKNLAQGGRQLYTGNLTIDFSNPLFEGSTVCIEGAKGSGKSTLALKAAQKFLKDGENCHIVYFNTNPKEAKKAKAELEEAGKNFTLVLPKDPNSASSVHLNVLATALHAISLKDQGKRVLVIIENCHSPLSAGLEISKDLGSMLITKNFIYALHDHSQAFKHGGSLTTLLMTNGTDGLDMDDPYYLLLVHYYQLVKCIANVTLSLDLADPEFKNLQPRVGMATGGDPFQFQPKYWNKLARKLQELLLKLKGERLQLDVKKELGFDIDPWDHYLYFDSKYFMKLLQNSLYFDKADEVLVLHFVLRSIETDTISYFTAPADSLIKDLLEFSKIARTAEEDSRSVSEFVKGVLDQQLEDEDVDAHLNRFFEQFFEEQRAAGKLSPTKSDYL